MPMPLNTKVQGAIRRRMSPLFQKERTEIPLKGAGEYPLPPRGPAPRPTGPGRGLAMGGGLGPGGGLGMGGEPKGMGMAGVPPAGMPMGAPMGGGMPSTPMGGGPMPAPMPEPMPEPTVPVERQRDVLLALILMLLGVGGEQRA